MNVDSLNMGIIVAVLIAISILLRSYLLLKYNWVGKDVFYHLLIAKEIRKNKKLPETVNYFIFPEKYNYPPFLHVFLSLFKEKYHQKLQFLSIIFDIVTGILIFIMVMHTFNIWIAIFSTTLYLITPISIDNSFTLGPRSIANMYMVAALFSLFYFFNTQIVIFAILAAIFTAFVLLTHRLTTQSLLFVLVSMSFGFKSITPLVIILIGIILAIIFSKGYYVKSAKGHINFIKCMAKGFQDRKTRLITPNILPNPIQFVFNMPILLALPVFSLFYDNIITKYFVIWGLSIVILSIIWVYGEGYRHIYNAIPPESIIAEIDYWYSKGYRVFEFMDDNFNLIRSRVIKICKLIKERNYGNIILNCPNGIRADTVDREILQLMKDVGFKSIAFGVESGNNKILKNLKKGETIEAIENAIEGACDVGLDVTLFFVIGSPGETKADIEDSIRLAQKYPIADVFFYSMIPYPKTELYDWVNKNNYFVKNPNAYLSDASANQSDVFFATPEFPVEDRKKMLEYSKVIKNNILKKSIARRYFKNRFLGKIVAEISCTNFAKKHILNQKIFWKLYNKYIIKRSNVTLQKRSD